MFDEEFQFFIAHQDELVAKHKGQFLVLQGSRVIDVRPTLLEAYLEGNRRFAPGTFMLQRCEPGPEAYTVTLSTWGLFSQATTA